MSKYQNIPGPRMGEPEIPQQSFLAEAAVKSKNF
jgi:hypothetical protein